ncbi:hypothetical protein IFR05_016839 [Cadophora sp. M221]|nr:hypothetical protein IFR05_016839 [Cadophora sp. M221]
MRARYFDVKRTVEYLITNDTLLNSSRPISYNLRMALSFAATSCEALIDFDDGREENNELQHMALTALDAVDLALKLEPFDTRVASISENEKKITKVGTSNLDIPATWTQRRST